MTYYDTATIEAYIEKEQIKVLAVMHDNFTHHETYVLGRTPDNLYKVLVYVGPDDDLTTYCYENAVEGMAALIDVACQTFLNLTDAEEPIVSELALAKQLRDSGLSTLDFNLKNASQFKLSGDFGRAILSLL